MSPSQNMKKIVNIPRRLAKRQKEPNIFFQQEDGFDYTEAFSQLIKLFTIKVFVVHYNWSNARSMIFVIFLFQR